jgi:hypothetical protein
MQEERKEKVEAKLYSGMPKVELTTDQSETIQKSEAVQDKSAVKGPISISLESLDLELQHNQSYGFVAAGTGCISNPGGPGC